MSTFAWRASHARLYVAAVLAMLGLLYVDTPFVTAFWGGVWMGVFVWFKGIPEQPQAPEVTEDPDPVDACGHADPAEPVEVDGEIVAWLCSRCGGKVSPQQTAERRRVHPERQREAPPSA